MKIDEYNFIEYLHKKDENALNYVIDTYSGLIKSIIRKHLSGIGQFEEECLNDVLLGVWNGIESFSDKDNSFKSWVAAITKYKCIDYKRKYIKLLKEDSLEKLDETHIKSAEESMLQHEINEEIESMLKFLSPTESEILKAYYIDDEEVDALADKMGIKPSAIYNNLSRSRKKLKVAFMKFRKGGIN